jgi:hypothetical protein
VMDLHMIAVAVAAVTVIAEQQIRVFKAKYLGEPPRRLIEVRSPEPDPSGRIRVDTGPWPLSA